MTWENKWPAIGAIAGVAALFLTLLLFILGHDTKELTVETVSTSILVDLSDPGLSSLKLTYKDVSVSRLTVATIEVRNSGTRPIERADFEAPLVLQFKNPIDVLTVSLGQKAPQDLKPVISSNDSGISIAPLLLNPGDTFRVAVQLRGDFNEPTVEARISGVPSISRRMFHASDPTRRGLIQIAAGVVTTFLYFYFAIVSGVIFRRWRPFTLISFPESLAVVMALGVGSAGLMVAGAKTFELSVTQIAGGGLLSAIVAIPFALWRASRLWAMLESRLP